MKPVSLFMLLMASFLVVLMGCSDNSAPIVAPGDQVVVPDHVGGLAKSAVLASASGNAQLYLDINGNPTAERSDVLRVYTFNAREYADGSYAGEVTSLGAPCKQWYMKATVVQLKVKGNKAKVIFKPYKGAGLLEGAEDYFVCHLVVDNGEGAKTDSPDMGTVWWFFEPSELQDFMHMSPDDFLSFLGNQQFPFDYLVPDMVGNVQVRGSSY
jgi:hypothetical protein